MSAAGVSRRPWGTLPTGEVVEALDLVGERLRLSVITFGARIARLEAPDRSGDRQDVVLGFDDLDGYLSDENFHGATVGRFANRIAGGRFTLDGVEHHVPANEGENALHGGVRGFDQHVWAAEPTSGDGEASVVLRRTSPDGEMGFPGTLDVQLTFTVAGPDLVLDYEARTDAPTVVSLTQHGYLNLAGHGSVDDHLLQVDAATYLPVDDGLLPVGGPEPVAGTPFDLRSPRVVGEVVRRAHPQVLRTRGIDHTYVLDGPVSSDGTTSGLRRAARLEHPGTGRTVEIWTDRPGLQVYTGGMLDGAVVGRGGRVHRQGDGLCLEPHQFPDAPNRAGYPSAVLRPGEVLRSREVLRTGVVD